MTSKPTRKVRLDPMAADEYPAWEALMVAEYARFQVEVGHWDAAGARQQALDNTRQLLPDGVATPGHHLWIARDVETGQQVGGLWIAIRPRGSQVEAFVYDIHVSAEQQGGGYGRAMMEAGAAAARRLGAVSIALNVHGGNDRAYSLYKSLGYEVTNRHMRLEL
jgi:ribosomal protein S18 acetylase RimI-like enzyme